MKKSFNNLQVAALRRTATNVWQYESKKQKIQEKIDKLQEEINEIDKQIEIIDYPTKQLTGYYSKDLFNRERIGDTSVYKFVLKYPDTVIPVEEEKNKDIINTTLPDTKNPEVIDIIEETQNPEFEAIDIINE